mgnify:FL=1
MQKNKMKRIISIQVIATLLALAICSCEKDVTTDGTGRSVDLRRDLALYINFDNNNCIDISGNGFDGAPVGDVQYVADTPNGMGKAISIDGTDRQFVNIPYTIIKDSINFSVSLWAKDFGTGTLFSSINGNYAQAPTFFVTSNTSPRIYYYGGSYEKFSFPLESYQSSGWHMITITAAGKIGELNLYVDAQKVDSKNVGNCEPRGNKMQIGGNADNYFDTWADPMLIDNFRVYRRCLSEKEIRELYKEEKN